MNPADVGLLEGRWVAALAVNLGFGLAAFLSGGVRGSGLLGGFLVGIPIFLFLGWPGFIVLTVMFVAGTLLTKLGYTRKQRMGVAEEKKGARGASHALANAGIAALCAAAAWWTGEPLLAVAFTAALATSSMDTAGSEMGPLLARRTVSLRTGRPVPPGTEGAVSMEGTLAGVGAALVVGVAGWLTGLHGASAVIAVAVGAVLGNLYEGILGARGILSHTWLNTTNTLVGAAAAVLVHALLSG